MIKLTDFIKALNCDLQSYQLMMVEYIEQGKTIPPLPQNTIGNQKRARNAAMREAVQGSTRNPDQPAPADQINP